jgi:ATP-binding cassette, subfamily G (WHITE), member 2, SNQ2
MRGSRPGSLIVRGEDYLDTSFGFSYDHIWRNLSVIILLALIFFIIGVIATDVLHFAPSGSVRLFARTKSAKERLRRQRKQLAQDGKWDPEVVDVDSSSSSIRMSFDDESWKRIVEDRAAVLAWKDVSLWNHGVDRKVQLLEDVCGYILPGEMTALMGVSGAGKTTCECDSAPLVLL